MISMFAFSVFARRPLRVLGAAAALLMGSTLAGQRAEALPPINPGMSKAGHTIASEPTIEVRGGHGGGGGGGGRGSFGGFGGGHSFGPGGFSGAVVRGGAIGAGPAIVAAPSGVAGPPRFAGHIAGGPGFAGHHFFHHRHFRGVFVGGVYYDDYPYDYGDYYDYPEYPPVYSVPVPVFVGGGGCRRVLTVHGPRVICHHRVARYHHIARRHYHRRHHRA
jgi:hypothetical protein